MDDIRIGMIVPQTFQVGVYMTALAFEVAFVCRPDVALGDYAVG